MVDYHETEGAQGGQEEQARSSQEEAANSGPEAKVAKTSEAPKLVIYLAVGWSPWWLKPVRHRKW